MNGIINIFKPKGLTSHDIVNIMRRTIGINKIGHTGILDPNASGVLLLCIGKATRISEYLLNMDKEYVGELSLGLATDTLDIDGKVINYSLKEVSEKEIYNAFDKFKGKILQEPPMYSALKHQGKKLYELARKGKVVKRAYREAFIYDMKILKNIDNKKIIFYTKCSKGTYIRTLCDDIGKVLGTYGYMSYLMRIGVGNFKVEDSYSIDYIKSLSKKDIKDIILPMDKALSHLDKLIMEDRYFEKLRNGARVSISKTMFNNYNKDSLLRIYSKDTFIGIGKVIEENNTFYLKMNKVLI
ncbi:tRNA pseudouridine synthase B [Keratinibaculum paraultunense]|uniref:tRNA pseudouridine synthase B n=1 Tax=Keratinibaculum paraultunense TaxID=1278232 RepID=A0A4R3KWL6_9FIRM|nr:tRNA pseudouridine(55) synthase TruB [Keratinibaculum paraultunense]QQY80694.1 tRNA pseudouridine(55) synthase TruB [Keratinibaculum paraultunense]TCS89703.1 tRNA pseudouridine synthase B [Keratinibaculum paraultunense]